MQQQKYEHEWAKYQHGSAKGISVGTTHYVGQCVSNMQFAVASRQTAHSAVAVARPQLALRLAIHAHIADAGCTDVNIGS